MRTAAYTLHRRRDGDWLDELEQIAEQVEEASPAARGAVRTTVESFLRASDTTRREPAPCDLRRAVRLLETLGLARGD